ncbi:MAG: hypothetical protein QM784_28305 [Polyangiaceae bacterium]
MNWLVRRDNVANMGSLGARTSILFVVLSSACTSPQKFDPASPIDVRSGGLGDRFEQRGVELDSEDMVDKLGERPASADDISRAKTYRVIAVIAAATGGALIGWPIGGAIGGDDKPPWVLAGVGAGFIAVSIPFSMLSSSAVSGAVESHNKSFSPKSTSASAPGTSTPTSSAPGTSSASGTSSAPGTSTPTSSTPTSSAPASSAPTSTPTSSSSVAAE